jgi:hypothetical protein
MQPIVRNNFEVYDNVVCALTNAAVSNVTCKFLIRGALKSIVTNTIIESNSGAASVAIALPTYAVPTINQVVHVPCINDSGTVTNVANAAASMTLTADSASAVISYPKNDGTTMAFTNVGQLKAFSVTYF